MEGLLGWAVAAVVVWLGMPVLNVVTTFAFGDGIEGVFKSQVLNSAVGLALHVGMTALLIRRLVKIAQPPAPAALAPQPPYR